MDGCLGLQLMGYGLLLAGLSISTHRLAPSIARPTLITGLAGGIVCLLLGWRAVSGGRGKALIVMTLLVVNYILLTEAVVCWFETSGAAPGHRAAAAVITAPSVLSVGMLMRVAYAGAQFAGEATRSAHDSETRSLR
jgi:hypothetical protein